MMNNTMGYMEYDKWSDKAFVNKQTPITGNDRVADDKLRTNDISGLSIPARPGQGAKL